MIRLFDCLPIINEKKEHDREEVLAVYDSFMLNRVLSRSLDTILFAQEMNVYNHLSKDVQFDFYYHGIPKGKRFIPWTKSDDTSDKALISVVCELYCVNTAVAKQYINMFSEEVKTKMLNMEGGKDGGTRNRSKNKSG
jgi:hypothetical protein